MESGRVSIKDIARAAGVSHSTVSRALGPSTQVQADTRARIRVLAEEMGYTPDARAQSLVRGRTQTVGVVVTTISDPFVAEVVQGIETTAYGQGYSVILASSDGQPERELAAVEMLRSRRVDAVIVTSSRVGAQYADRLAQAPGRGRAPGVPVVLLNNHEEAHGPYTHTVRVDDHHGGRMATRHLLQAGHRRIAYIAGGEGNSTSLARQAGYAAALMQAQIAHDPVLVVPGNGRAQAGEQALRVLRALSEPPTAVFCYNDLTAIGLLRAAREAGVGIPADLAVVGFDDIPMAAYTWPSLTTVAQPKFDLGRRAVEMAVALIQEGPEHARDVVLQGWLIVRESCGAGQRLAAFGS